MVPGSTLIYGSVLSIVTLRPRLSSSAPRDAAASPLPREETTPPVTKINLVFTVAINSFHPICLADNVPRRANPPPYRLRSTIRRLPPHKSDNRFATRAVARDSRSFPARSAAAAQSAAENRGEKHKGRDADNPTSAFPPRRLFWRESPPRRRAGRESARAKNKARSRRCR